MKIATWNVNSVRTRLERVLAFLERHQPDVLCLQETKATDDVFPANAFESAGYHSTVHGQKTYNGVAFLSREPAEEVMRGFNGNPVPEQARVISARFGGVCVLDLYVINGKAVDTEHYQRKLAWLDALWDWVEKEHDPEQPLVVLGDFNIAPQDRDVYDPDKWRGKVLFSEPELSRLKRMMDWGLTDLFRLHHSESGLYSWWDYRAGAFHKGWGLRIDLLLGTHPVAERCSAVEIDREERKPDSGEGKPSDHAPVIATLS